MQNDTGQKRKKRVEHDVMKQNTRERKRNARSKHERVLSYSFYLKSLTGRLQFSKRRVRGILKWKS